MPSRIICARTICDGSGVPPFAGRVVIADGVIRAVEPLPSDAPEIRALPEDGRILAPGLIDSHGHSDLSVFAMPEAEGKARQGITTEIAGNCGLSAFPLTGGNRAHLEELYRNYRTPLAWHDFASYRAAQKARHPALDVIPLVGHNTLRAAVAGYEKKHLSAAEIARMQELLDRELAAGAPGLSGGFLYVPGCFAAMEEVVALLEVVARYDRIFTIHLRSEGDRLEEALDETLTAARRAGLGKIHLSHLKTAGAANFHKLPSILNALNTKDLRVTGDVYPYTAAMTQCGAVLPEPYDTMSDTALTVHLADEGRFQTALAALRRARQSDYWRNVMIVNAAPAFQDCAGKMLTVAAERRQLPPEELFLRLIQCDAVNTVGAFHTLSRENMEVIARHEHVVPGSDESARNRTLRFGASHPRGFGTMPEYFQLLRARGQSAAAVIARMTGIPAGIFGLADRGLIAPGRRADLIWLDPEKFRARATYEKPHLPAEGVEPVA